MGLLKNITSDKGIVTKYHSIQEVYISPRFNKICMKVRSYTDESYRNLEKEEFERSETIKEINTKLNREIQEKGEAYYETDEFKSLEEQLQSLVSQQVGLDLAVSEESYEIPYSDDFSVAKGYDYLKTLEKFDKAKNSK